MNDPIREVEKAIQLHSTGEAATETHPDASNEAMAKKADDIMTPARHAT